LDAQPEPLTVSVKRRFLASIIALSILEAADRIKKNEHMLISTLNILI
jgi:hypothetical protein